MLPVLTYPLDAPLFPFSFAPLDHMQETITCYLTAKRLETLLCTNYSPLDCCLFPFSPNLLINLLFDHLPRVSALWIVTQACFTWQHLICLWLSGIQTFHFSTLTCMLSADDFSLCSQAWMADSLASVRPGVGYTVNVFFCYIDIWLTCLCVLRVTLVSLGYAFHYFTSFSLYFVFTF